MTDTQNHYASTWVRFAECCPAENAAVLIWYDIALNRKPGYVATLDYDSEAYPMSWLQEQGITHWMPVPNGPLP